MRQKLIERERFHHGHKDLLAELINLSKKSGNKDGRKVIINVMYNLLLSGNEISELLDLYVAWQDQLATSAVISSMLIEKLVIIEISLADLFEQIEYLYTIILLNVIEGTPVDRSASKVTGTYGTDPAKKICMSFKIFEIVISEALINVKKHSKQGFNNLTINFETDNQLVLLSLKNTSRNVSAVKLKKLNKPNKNNVHGVALIDRISERMYHRRSEKFCRKTLSSTLETIYEFELKLPIATI